MEVIIEKIIYKIKLIKLSVKNVKMLLNQRMLTILKCAGVVQLVLMEDMNI